jgi:hypothetical protein
MSNTDTKSASENPDPLIREVVADMPGAALSRAAFTAILDGQMPLLSDLTRAAAASTADVDALTGRRLVVDDLGRVVAAHGLSLVPARQHRLMMADRQFWTWCAIDAIGIPAGLAADAVAATTCHLCSTPVHVEFHAGAIAHSSHAAARVWDAQRLPGRGTAGPPHCALMNLFCSAEHLEEWLATHPGESGRARTLAEVAEIGRAEWGAAMDGRDCGADEWCP